MSTRPETTEHGGPVGWPQISLYLTVLDGRQSLHFYEAAFGFKPNNEQMVDADGNIQHAGMLLGEAAIMFAPEGPGNPMRAPVSAGAVDSQSFYIYVADVDALFERARSAGAIVLQPPQDQFWGDRITELRCPNGYRWTFATHVAGFDPAAAASH